MSDDVPDVAGALTAGWAGAGGCNAAGVVGGVCSTPCPGGDSEGLCPLPEAVMSTTGGGGFVGGVLSPVGVATGVVAGPAGVSPAVVDAGDGPVAGEVDAVLLPSLSSSEPIL